MDLKLVEEKYLKMNKKDRLSYRRMINYEKKKNENNCFLFALLGISDNFSIHNHAKYFKNHNLSTQIELANDVLIKSGLKLKEKNISYQTLRSKIKTISGNSILIMYNSNLDIHAEAIIDNQFTEYSQDIIYDYIDESLTIMEMKIENIQKYQIKD